MRTPDAELVRLFSRAVEGLVPQPTAASVIDETAAAVVPQVAIEATNGHSIALGAFTVEEQKRQINLEHPDSILQRGLGVKVAPMVALAPSALSIAFHPDAARALGAFLIAAADHAEGGES